MATIRNIMKRNMLKGCLVYMGSNIDGQCPSYGTDEKVLVAHCLISSLESKQDEGVEEAWAELAEKRYLDLESGAVKGLSWEEIKKEVKG